MLVPGGARSSVKPLRKLRPVRTALLARTRLEQLQEKCEERGLSTKGDEEQLDSRLNKWLEQKLGMGTPSVASNHISTRLQVALGKAKPAKPKTTQNPQRSGARVEPRSKASRAKPLGSGTGAGAFAAEKRATKYDDADEPSPPGATLAADPPGPASSTAGRAAGERTLSTEAVAEHKPKESRKSTGDTRKYTRLPARKKAAKRTAERNGAAYAKMERDPAFRELARAKFAYKRAKDRLKAWQKGELESELGRWEDNPAIPRGADIVKSGNFAGMSYDKLWRTRQMYCRLVYKTPIHQVRDATTAALKTYLLRHSAEFEKHERSRNSVIDFGEEYLNRTYEEVLSFDPDFCQFMRKRYHSSPASHRGLRDFVEWIETEGIPSNHSMPLSMPLGVVGFGKYKSYSIKEVLEEQPKWCAIMLHKFLKGQITSPQVQRWASEVKSYIRNSCEDDVVPFGKFRGRAYGDVLSDLAYCKYLVGLKDEKRAVNIEVLRLAAFLEKRGFNLEYLQVELSDSEERGDEQKGGAATEDVEMLVDEVLQNT